MGAVPRRQGHAPGVTPWPALSPWSVSGRAGVGEVEDATVLVSGWRVGSSGQRLRAKQKGRARVTRGANVAATAGGADGCAGVSGLLGRLAGPRARALRLAGRRGPSRSSPRGLVLPFSFSVLHFFSIV